MRQTIFWILTLILHLVLPGFVLHARTKLVALPERASIRLELSHPDTTLVEEERVLPLQKGANQIDFSWKGVNIDPDSIRIRILSHPDQVHLLSVSYPPNEAALVWSLYSENSWEVRVRISYLLSAIDRLVTYKAMATKDEDQVDLESYLVLRNFSGEEFDRVMVRLDYGEAFESSIAHEETKRTLLLHRKNLPITKTYTFDANLLPWDPKEVEDNVGIPVHYVIKNDEDSGLGEHGLWDGKARIFQDDGHESTIFLGEDMAGYVPVNESMKLYIGDSRDIVVTQRKIKEERIHIRKNNSGSIVLFDTDELMDVKVENFKDKEATLTLIQTIPGQWDMAESTHDFTKKDANNLEFSLSIPAQDNIQLQYNYHRRNLRN